MSASGKSLEEMAAVFGDEVDVGDILEKHGDHITEAKSSTVQHQEHGEKGDIYVEM